MRVLLVDDNFDLAQTLATTLRNRGADVVVVADGDAAAARAGEAWDVALVDLKLPGRSGEQVIDALESAGRPRLLAAMTGFESPDVLRRVGGRVDRVLRKPFDFGELFDLLGLERTAPSRINGHPRIAGIGWAETPSPFAEFTDAEALRSAVLEVPFDAVALPPGDQWDELAEDILVLDRDVSVTRCLTESVAASAVDRSRDRRDRSAWLGSLEQAFEHVPLPAALLRDGLIESVNRAGRSLLGYRDAEFGRLGPEDLCAASERAALRALIADAGGGTTSGLRMGLRLRGGALRPVITRARQLSESPPRVLLSFSSALPEQGHDEALRLLGATAAGVAHEMRNAMAGVGSSLKVLQGRLEAGPEAEVLDRVIARVSQASEVMNDLLAFARPLRMRLITVPARLIIDSVASHLRDAAAGAEVRIDVPDSTLRVLVDPTALQMALLNLGANALAVTEQMGPVTLGCRRSGEHILLEVIDEGPGVPEAVRDRIFEPFFTTRSSGTGLGLANVRKVVEAHQGSIRLRPSLRGAHFEIRLPPRPQAVAPPRGGDL